MKKKLRFVSSALAFSLFCLGCGADCESICEDRKECADASPDELARDCARSCEAEAKTGERFGCKPQADDLVDCIANLEELCDPPPDACSAEQASLYQCNRKYCAAHPEDGDCS